MKQLIKAYWLDPSRLKMHEETAKSIPDPWTQDLSDWHEEMTGIPIYENETWDMGKNTYVRTRKVDLVWKAVDGARQ